jgi:hypothetical protein
MNLLDENIREDQRAALKELRIPFRQIGYETAPAGTQDDTVIPLLHHLKRPTFFTQDKDFLKAFLRHQNYCLAILDVPPKECAFYIRHFLRHPRFRHQARRMGTVVRVHSRGVKYWEGGHAGQVSLAWPIK